MNSITELAKNEMMMISWQYEESDNNWKDLDENHSNLCEKFYTLKLGKFQTDGNTYIFDTIKMIMRKKRSKNLYDNKKIRRLIEITKS